MNTVFAFVEHKYLEVLFTSDGNGDGLMDWNLVLGKEGIALVGCCEERVEPKCKALIF